MCKKRLSKKISIIGSRGIPANYGGFETFAEQLSIRLAQKNYYVIVGCEFSDEKINTYKGVKLKYFPIRSPNNYIIRKLYEIFYDIYFMIDLSFSSDYMYLLGVGTSGGFYFIPKILNRTIKLIINTDGVEWKRSKFTFLERSFIKLNTNLAIKFSDILVLDAERMRDYIKEKHKSKSIFIPYGVQIPDFVKWDKDELMPLSLRYPEIANIQRDDYWLIVARLEPENNIDIMLTGFLNSKTNRPILVVGNATSKKYMGRLTELASIDKNKHVLFLGGIYDRALLNMLRQHCYAYLHGHSIGGTNPSLLEAMASKNIIISHDNEFNREVCGESAIYFKNCNDLSEIIDHIDKNINLYLHFKVDVFDKCSKNYEWDKIILNYTSIFD
jgi:rhamnosyltransferase